MKRSFKSAVIATSLALGSTTLISAAPAFAADEINLRTGIAVQGYDVVSYRTDAGPLKGSDQFTATHEGATYQFASEENLNTFLADPARYIPAYGGFCAFGVAKGQKVKVDPDAFSIVDDTLYLNYSKRIQRRWDKKQADYIMSADENWTKIRPVAKDDL